MQSVYLSLGLIKIIFFVVKSKIQCAQKSYTHHSILIVYIDHYTLRGYNDMEISAIELIY